jgi:DNA polymerase III epsilon subunit-like protein
MPRTERNLFFVDTETTGLKSDYHEIIQVSAILTKPDGKEVTERYSARIKPIYPERIDPKAAAVNGFKAENYTDETCTPRDEVINNLIRLSQGAIPVGQNIKFDVGFLTTFLNGQTPWHYHSIDTMVLAWPFFVAKKIDYFNLDTLCDFFKIPRPKIHTATEDIEATFKVYHELMNRLAV